jgi:hypothetical protein
MSIQLADETSSQSSDIENQKSTKDENPIYPFCCWSCRMNEKIRYYLINFILYGMTFITYLTIFIVVDIILFNNVKPCLDKRTDIKHLGTLTHYNNTFIFKDGNINCTIVTNNIELKKEDNLFIFYTSKNKERCGVTNEKKKAGCYGNIALFNVFYLLLGSFPIYTFFFILKASIFCE